MVYSIYESLCDGIATRYASLVECLSCSAGCFHEFCTHCALYLCSTSNTSIAAHGPPGSIPCPLCRHGIVSFIKLADTTPIIKEAARTSLSLPFCSCTADGQEPTTLETPLCKPDLYCSRLSPLGSSFLSLSCQKFPALRFSPGLCMGTPDTSPSLVPRTGEREHLTRCSRPSFRRSTSNVEARRWLCSFSHSVETGSSF